MPYTLVGGYRSFSATHCLCLHSWALNITSLCFSERSVPLHIAAQWQRVPQPSGLYVLSEWIVVVCGLSIRFTVLCVEGSHTVGVCTTSGTAYWTGLDWNDRAKQPRGLMAVLWETVRQSKQLMAVLFKLCATTDLLQGLANSVGPLHKGIW